LARKATVEAFAVWIADEANVDQLLDLIKGGMTLRDAAMALKQPYTCARDYFRSTDELKARLQDAKESCGTALMEEAKEIADEVEPHKDEVAKAKLRIETRHIIAKSFNRPEWGDKVSVEKNVTVGVDKALLASVDDLLRLASEKVIVEVPAAMAIDNAATTLPAPLQNEDA
jgi:hypothetical protein